MDWVFTPPPVIQTELERLRAKIAEVFDIPEQLLGVTYEGEFLPTGPVVESTIEKAGE